MCALCLRKTHHMIITEFMENGALDAFLRVRVQGQLGRGLATEPRPGTDPVLGRGDPAQP